MADSELTAASSRRSFIKKSVAATAGLSAGLMASGNFAYAGGSDTIRYGLIGCGGRGTGAARDCAKAAEGTELVAMGDLFEDRLDQSREILKEVIPDSYKATEQTSYAGFEAYRHVIESDVDLVLIASPPGFHPMHMQAAVDAGKHVFLEKPAGVDPAGIASVRASGKKAEEKGLSMVTGTIYRRQPNFVDAIQQIHNGAIGELLSSTAYYLTGSIWLRERKPGMSDMEWQCRNWYYFDWLSGDHIVEQFVHNMDVHHWVHQGLPEQALATGGRQQRVDPSFGHIYDHFSVDFEFADGAHMHAACRQMENTETRIANRFVGTKGVADLNPTRSVIKTHDGEVLYDQEKGDVNPYVTEHEDLIRSIREGEPINETEDIAGSTMMGILGRESAYTGQHLTMEALRTSGLNLLPDTFEFGSMPVPPVPTPGVTTLDRRSPKKSSAATAQTQ